jgi:two-component system chemotaxis sensor kinase CheA
LSEDLELRGLLVKELQRHLESLAQSPPDLVAAGRAVHALKGAAGLADQRELASALQRLERRFRDDDIAAVADAAVIVRTAIHRLSTGASAITSVWPVPPEDLGASLIDPAVRAEYAAEIHDHIAGIDAALAAPLGDPEAPRDLRRHVHTIKGAASAVGDEVMTWFCHGLEDRLKVVDPHGDAPAHLIEELGRWRGVLAALADDPHAALQLLRTPAQRASKTPSAHPVRADEEWPRVAADEATVRVATSSVDRLLDRFASIGLVRERVASRVETSREQSRELRRLRADLAEALRMIGPPRPWGAPQAALRRIEWTSKALASLGDELDQAGSDLRGGDLVLRDAVAEARADVSRMRQTPIRQIFARISSAVEAEARRSGRAIIVRTQGADEAIDRRIAEALMEPCLQLARNAVAHGIEPPEVRLRHDKPETGTISMSARRIGNRLSVTIEDDGAGVDVASLRERAVEIGVVAPALAEAADDNTLLALLFLPGFSTRETSDLLAGRGIGLDIALNAVQRLGGVIRLSSRRGEGFTARVDIAVESGLASVLWVTVDGEQYALPAAQARAVQKIDPRASPPPSLAACFETAPSSAPGGGFARPQGALAHAIVLDDDEPGKSPVRVAVDEVGRTEELLIRPLSPLLAGIGPFSGVIARGDGTVRLALDVYALAPRARTLGRMPEGRPSERPPPSRPPRRLA